MATITKKFGITTTIIFSLILLFSCSISDITSSININGILRLTANQKLGSEEAGWGDWSIVDIEYDSGVFENGLNYWGELGDYVYFSWTTYDQDELTNTGFMATFLKTDFSSDNITAMDSYVITQLPDIYNYGVSNDSSLLFYEYNGDNFLVNVDVTTSSITYKFYNISGVDGSIDFDNPTELTGEAPPTYYDVSTLYSIQALEFPEYDGVNVELQKIKYIVKNNHEIFITAEVVGKIYSYNSNYTSNNEVVIPYGMITYRSNIITNSDPNLDFINYYQYPARYSYSYDYSHNNTEITYYTDDNYGVEPYVEQFVFDGSEETITESDNYPSTTANYSVSESSFEDNYEIEQFHLYTPTLEDYDEMFLNHETDLPFMFNSGGFLMELIYSEDENTYSWDIYKTSSDGIDTSNYYTAKLTYNIDELPTISGNSLAPNYNHIYQFQRNDFYYYFKQDDTSSETWSYKGPLDDQWRNGNGELELFNDDDSEGFYSTSKYFVVDDYIYSIIVEDDDDDDIDYNQRKRKLVRAKFND